MNIEQLRAEFGAWHAEKYWAPLFDDELGRFIPTVVQNRWEAYQAGRAALQSQKPEPSDVMLSGVIRMPFEMAMADPVSRMQFYQRAQQALNELEALQHSCKETPQDRQDAERYRFIRSKVYASNVYGRASWKFHYDNLPLPLDNPTRGSVKQHFEDAIDHARRVEEEDDE